MQDRFQDVRRQVLRRVRYATNAAALRDDRLPPEAPYDAALTNGLLTIVAEEWPGEEFARDGRMKAARDLLGVISRHGNPFPYVDASVLLDGLDLTQPARHGRSDDEFAVLSPGHIDAIIALDQHPALEFVNEASGGRDVSALLWRAFEERACAEVPFDPGDGSVFPDPEECDECWRPTFLPTGWDMFGATNATGQCIACGYIRTGDEALDLAIEEAFDRAMDRLD